MSEGEKGVVRGGAANGARGRARSPAARVAIEIRVKKNLTSVRSWIRVLIVEGAEPAMGLALLFFDIAPEKARQDAGRGSIGESRWRVRQAHRKARASPGAGTGGGEAMVLPRPSGLEPGPAFAPKPLHGGRGAVGERTKIAAN